MAMGNSLEAARAFIQPGPPVVDERTQLSLGDQLARKTGIENARLGLRQVAWVTAGALAGGGMLYAAAMLLPHL
jgi:hypothetical protein